LLKARVCRTLLKGIQSRRHRCDDDQPAFSDASPSALAAFTPSVRPSVRHNCGRFAMHTTAFDELHDDLAARANRCLRRRRRRREIIYTWVYTDSTGLATERE